jgi:hypothetical protein
MARYWLRDELQSGPAMRAGRIKLTPAARVLHLRAPRLPLALSWQRPLAVFVEHPDGSVAKVPVRDPTRWWQVGLLTLAGLGALFLVLGPGTDRARR